MANGYGGGYGGGFRQPNGFGGQNDAGAFNTAFGQQGGQQGVQQFGGQPAYNGGAYGPGVTGEGVSPFYRSANPAAADPSAQSSFATGGGDPNPFGQRPYPGAGFNPGANPVQGRGFPFAPPPELPPWVTPGTPGNVGAKGGAITGGPMFADPGQLDYGYNPGDQGYAGPGQQPGQGYPWSRFGGMGVRGR